MDNKKNFDILVVLPLETLDFLRQIKESFQEIWNNNAIKDNNSKEKFEQFKKKYRLRLTYLYTTSARTPLKVTEPFIEWEYPATKDILKSTLNNSTHNFRIIHVICEGSLSESEDYGAIKVFQSDNWNSKKNKVPFTINGYQINKIKERNLGLRLFILQSGYNSADVYKSFEKTSFLLTKNEIPAVLTNPNILKDQFKDFIKNLYNGIFIGESIGKVIANIRRQFWQDEFFGMPVLYLRDKDFTFLEKPKPNSEKTGNTEPPDPRNVTGAKGTENGDRGSKPETIEATTKPAIEPSKGSTEQIKFFKSSLASLLKKQRKDNDMSEKETHDNEIQIEKTINNLRKLGLSDKEIFPEDENQ